jgi:hypothetical protein
MIGRRSISARSEFSCGSRLAEGAGLTLPLLLVDKRGPAPVDNSSMALRMQAQGSALFEFVAFCLCLSSAALLFRVLFQLRTAFRRLASPAWRPSSRMRPAICNRQFGGQSSPPASFISFYCLHVRNANALLRALLWFKPRRSKNQACSVEIPLSYVSFDFAFYFLQKRRSDEALPCPRLQFNTTI